MEVLKVYTSSKGELAEIRDAAARDSLPVSAWARQVLVATARHDRANVVAIAEKIVEDAGADLSPLQHRKVIASIATALRTRGAAGSQMGRGYRLANNLTKVALLVNVMLNRVMRDPDDERDERFAAELREIRNTFASVLTTNR